MASQDSSTDKISLLRDELKEKLGMIQTCKTLIKAINATVIKYPALSELAAEAIEGNKQIIQIYVNEIRNLNGKKS